MKTSKINKTYRRNKIFCSKKADISIVLLVFMTLALVGVALFSFMMGGKIDKKISDAKFLETTYAVEGKIDFYLAGALEQAIVKAYKDAAGGQVFVGSGCSTLPEKTDGIEKEFCRVDSNANAAFKEKIEGYFKENINALDFPESETTLNGLKNNIEQNRFSVEFDGKSTDLNANDIRINSQFNAKKQKKILWIIPVGEEITVLVGVNYEPNIMIKTELADLGLSDFEAIYQKTTECKNANSISSCNDAEKDVKITGFNSCLSGKLAYFAINAEARCISSKPYFLAELKSGELFIDGDFEAIGIKFIVAAE